MEPKVILKGKRVNSNTGAVFWLGIYPKECYLGIVPIETGYPFVDIRAWASHILTGEGWLTDVYYLFQDDYDLRTVEAHYLIQCRREFVSGNILLNILEAIDNKVLSSDFAERIGRMIQVIVDKLLLSIMTKEQVACHKLGLRGAVEQLIKRGVVSKDLDVNRISKILMNVMDSVYSSEF